MKLVRIFVCCFFFFPSLQGLAPDFERIFKNGRLVVALYAQDRPPFFQEGFSGELEGFDVDFSRDLAARMGVKVEFLREAKSFDAVIHLVETQRADLAISKLSSTLSRAMRVRFSAPYLFLKQTLLIHRKQAAKLHQRSNESSYLDHRQAKIGTLEKTAYEAYLKQLFPRAQHILYKDKKDLFQEVLKGNITAIMIDNSEVDNFIGKEPKAALYLQVSILKNKDPLAIALHWQDSLLHQWVNFYIQEIIREGTMKKLQQKYFSNLAEKVKP